MKKKFFGFLTFVILMGFSVSYGATFAGKTFVQTTATRYDPARIQSALHSAEANLFYTLMGAEFYLAAVDLQEALKKTPADDALINQYADKIFCLLTKYGRPVLP